ncbi:MAG: CbbQ/NirQ/NorQ/GpvN family protein [Ottowia sp.]|uniref:CbbQ/NirQ/NorQ/GpvN family protein n=1 Tax=Ottowia sp. TaxID=1898956 RepID=UPI0039E463FA
MAPDPLAAWRLAGEPFYRASGDEIRLCMLAFERRLPLLLKGPTGCGKTRFVEHMAWRLGRPLVTLACNEDMTASDLLGRYLIDAEGTRWHDGPLTQAVRHGAICYLDEVVEAHRDTTVVIHPLADTRRVLALERRGELVPAHPDFQLVISYNPGYQERGKDLKPSTRQRFVALEFGYPAPEVEAAIVAHEAGVAPELAARLVEWARGSRALRPQGLEEGASTRMLVRAGQLLAAGAAPAQACDLALVCALTDDADTARALRELVAACFGG